jgi:flavin reductase (DIM6/NTAB) family NADH-FMN oxidoreductase RutF
MIANGLFVLTASSDDEVGAATVSWVSQSSFRPPLVVAALRRGSNVHECLRHGAPAVLHVLGEGQESIARKFFSTTRVEGDLLNGEPFDRAGNGAPVLRNLPNHVETQVRHFFATEGDHDLVVMEVLRAHSNGSARPLTVADSPWEYGG